MDLSELLRVLWQRKLIVVLMVALAVGIGVASLSVQTKIYEATSTIALTPVERTNNQDADPIFIISQIDVITPLYAEAVTTEDTKILARRLGERRSLGEVNVRTFRGAPILKIDVRSPNPTVARESAQAITDAVIRRSDRGEVGIRNLNVQQIDRPILPTEPVAPQPKLTLLVAIILGLGFGVAAAVAWDRLRHKVDTVDELASVVGVPVFGEIPVERAVGQFGSPSALVTDPRYRIIAEVLRDIRTSLQFTDSGVRSLLITSPEGRHGKTFLSVGLAATLARAGARTLLVDGDLRHGRVAEVLRQPRVPGLVEVLDGTAGAGAVQLTELDQLSVLTGGEYRQDPGELLESKFFPTLYELEAAYDLVVIDGPPLLPINDARLMAKYVSSVVLVVGSGTLTRRQIRAAVDRLAIIDVQLTAVVMNMSRTRRRASYYRYLKPATKP